MSEKRKEKEVERKIERGRKIEKLESDKAKAWSLE
jgi:hypothetical protein